jgi:hypothetical protein
MRLPDADGHASNGRPQPPHRPTWTDVLGLSAIADRFDAGMRRLRAAEIRAGHAAKLADREAAAAEAELAEALRREAMGEFHRAGSDLAELFLLLLRYCRMHQPEALAAALAEVLRPELTQLADDLARLKEGGGKA